MKWLYVGHSAASIYYWWYPSASVSVSPVMDVGQASQGDIVMSESIGKLNFAVIARRIDMHGSVVRCKDAEIILDTDLGGRLDAFNPAELLLAALSACMIKSIERVTPILKFRFRGVEVRVSGIRQDVPPRMESIDYEILVDTDESEQRLALLHENVRKYGTVFNTVVPGTALRGIVRRAD